MIKRDEKKKIIKQYGTHQGDSGSPQVQVAILTFRINDLKKHLTKHTHDDHSRRGLIMMVGQRRKLLKYMNDRDPASYTKIVKELELRK